MFCKYCGKPIDNDSKFCSYCGSSFDSAPKNIADTTDAAAAPASAAPEQKLSVSKPITNFLRTSDHKNLCAYVIFGLLGISLILYFTSWFKFSIYGIPQSFSFFSLSDMRRQLLSYYYMSYNSSYTSNSSYSSFLGCTSDLSNGYLCVLILASLFVASGIFFFKKKTVRFGKETAYYAFIVTSAFSVLVPTITLIRVAANLRNAFSAYGDSLLRVYGFILNTTASPYIIIGLSVIALLLSIYSFKSMAKK